MQLLELWQMAKLVLKKITKAHGPLVLVIGDLGQRNLVIWPCWWYMYSPDQVAAFCCTGLVLHTFCVRMRTRPALFYISGHDMVGFTIHTQIHVLGKLNHQITTHYDL